MPVGAFLCPLMIAGAFFFASNALSAPYASTLRITELMYHPASGGVAGDEDNYEFLELKNLGTASLNLSGCTLDGINYTFPPSTTIAPGGFYVMARNQTAFLNRYPGVKLNGVYTGKLDDGGEKIRLFDPGSNTVVSVEYGDDPPWPVSPDGLSYSLVLANPVNDPDWPDTWRASSNVHGSPGADDPTPPYGLGVIVNEVMAHTDPPFEDAIELYNTSSNAVDISGWYLSDNFVRTNVTESYKLKKYRIPQGTVISAGGFKVFYQRDFDYNNTNTPFALSELGETVYLSSATPSGTLNGYVIGATFGPSDNDVSIGRYYQSQGMDFVPLNRTTFGKDTPDSLADFRLGTGATNAAPRVGPLILNEVMYNPAAGGSEFIEFLSLTNGPLDISGWTIEGAEFTFPSATVAAANSFVLLLRTNTMTVDAFRARYEVPVSVPIFGYEFILENGGESLSISKPNELPAEPFIQVEYVRYNNKLPWPAEADGKGPSLERFSASQYGNDPVNWRTGATGGSPGRPNPVNPIRLAFRYDAGGNPAKFEVTMRGYSNAWYVLESSTNLVFWSAVATNLAGPEGACTHLETNSLQRRFYRGKPL